MEFEKIYRAYFDDVYRYLLRLTEDEHLAQELTSDTFFRAMRSIGRFRGECEMRVWLCQIAKNCYLNAVKRHRVTLPMDDVLLPTIADPDGDVAEAAARGDTVRRLQGLLHTLPEPYREVFMWRVYAELSFGQIGAIFQKTENWACVTYHRARQMLQKKWEDEYGT